MMTVSEMRRFQGVSPNRIHYGKAKASRKTGFARAMSGHTMSVKVLQKLLPPLLKSAGLAA